MNWLRRIFGERSSDSSVALRLDYDNCWEVSATQDCAAFLRALPLIADADGFVYLEGIRSTLLHDELTRLSVPTQAEIHKAMIWPRPDRYHLPLSPPVLEALAAFLEAQPDGRLCFHCHVYRRGELLLAWYDAFADPMYIAGSVEQARVFAFAKALDVSVTRHAG